MKDFALAAALTAVGIVLAGTVLPAAHAQGKPINAYDVHADGGVSAGSLNDLWKLSAVVAEAHVGAPRFDDGMLRSMGLPALTYDARIVTLFKGDKVVTGPESPISVSRIGGRVDRGDHIADYVDSKFARFVPEKTYILFLRRDATGRYWPATGTADSTYLIEGEAIRTLGKSSLITTISRMTRSTLVDALTRLAGGG
jgi:hypothetical protein